MPTSISSALMRHTAVLLIMLMTTLAFVPRVEAGLVPTSLSEASATHAQDLASIQKVLENKSVQARLSALGYTEGEISAKLSQLSGQELHGLASQLNALDAGGDGLGLIVVLLVIVLLVVVILKVSDKTVTIR